MNPADRPGRRNDAAPVDRGAAVVSVRGEDVFDVEALARWLLEAAGDSPVLSGVELGTAEAVTVPEVRQFAGGASNLTYLLRYPGVDLVLRRPPSGTKARGAHDMRREHDVQAALRPVFPLVPRMVAYCDDESVIGSEFYVMERLHGTILRREIPTDLGLDLLRTRRLCERAVDTLADLHSVDVEAAGLAWLGRGDGYVERQVQGWAARYRRARTPDVGGFDTVIDWLERHRPDDVGQCLIHNDYRFDNLVLDPADPSRIVGVLDWEMATVGDPLMDLGGALAYWVQADDGRVFRRFRRQPTHAPGMLTRSEVLDRYAQRTGRRVSDRQWVFYEVFGLFRLAVIAQQIHHRYFLGQTTNPAFRHFRLAVLMLEQRCLRVIRTSDRRRRASVSGARPGGLDRTARAGLVDLARGVGRAVADSARLLPPLAGGVVHAVRARRPGGRGR